MRKLIVLTLAGFWASAGGRPATGGATNDEIAPEAVGAVAVCAICHGATGEGNQALGAPRIGGLSASYITRQLEYFRTGVRGGTDEDPYGTQMRAIAMTLEDFQASSEDLGQYFAQLEPPKASPTIVGNAERGEELYPVCAACHGEDGHGIAELNAPSIAGQADWYVVRQLEYYRDGLRGGNPNDALGTQMVSIVNSLPDGDAINDLVAYINKL